MGHQERLGRGRRGGCCHGQEQPGPGSCIYRQAWSTEKVDLFKLKDTLGVGFAHKNGFYAVVASEASDRAIMGMLSIASNVE